MIKITNFNDSTHSNAVKSNIIIEIFCSLNIERSNIGKCVLLCDFYIYFTIRV